ncbi:hypothetical protein [Gynuella sunshinyii]|uniref:P pilus assembly/Cpx signaling pathway, periplasmic inhibitor/zinc-resistance associated protein n=1 Tax=Gynuella sunshinyii YC6258 TaxID=1445510 RepID=A0A0C5VQT1_9GAMM|nr:hypothetical protein [Gynuella sunshinyii]AJQ92624.1 p pilus assembly/Cpx signaling pathway, periplasmic inhibitor/zinc-resistance associated protein [Gynuella sunshinyii YC6258]
MNSIVKTVIIMAMSVSTGMGIASISAAETNSHNCDSGSMRPPPAMMGQNFEYIFGQLNITEEQGKQVLDILKQQRDTMRETMQTARQQVQAGPPTEDERKAIQAAMREQLRVSLTPVLSNEQIEGFLDYFEAHMPAGRPHGQKPDRPDTSTDSDTDADLNNL